MSCLFLSGTDFTEQNPINESMIIYNIVILAYCTYYISWCRFRIVINIDILML